MTNFNESKFAAVHAAHCCKIHGCKYGNVGCPVVLGEIESIYKCEDCEDGLDQIDPVTQSINELKQEIIKLQKIVQGLVVKSEVLVTSPSVENDDPYAFATRFAYYSRGIHSVDKADIQPLLVRLIEYNDGNCILCTPHGSAFSIKSTVMSEFTLPLNHEQREQLRELEFDAMKRGITIYKKPENIKIVGYEDKIA